MQITRNRAVDHNTFFIEQRSQKEVCPENTRAAAERLRSLCAALNKHLVRAQPHDRSANCSSGFNRHYYTVIIMITKFSWGKQLFFILNEMEETPDRLLEIIFLTVFFIPFSGEPRVKKNFRGKVSGRFKYEKNKKRGK